MKNGSLVTAATVAAKAVNSQRNAPGFSIKRSARKTNQMTLARENPSVPATPASRKIRGWERKKINVQQAVRRS